MKNSFNVFLLVGLLLASSAAFPQSLTAVNSAGPAPSGVTIPGPDDVLWDNTVINNTTAGIISTRFGGFPAGAQLTNTADDFVVPAGQLWDVTFIYSEGFTNAATNADSFEVTIYADAGGSPGAIIDSQVIPFGGAVTMTTQELALPNPVQLTGGTYWLSIVGAYDTGTDPGVTRWNWSTGPDGIGSDWYLQDPAGLFGGIPWTSATGLGIADVSALFAIRGTESSALPESVPVPTLSQWGLILLVLTLAGLAGTVLVRRA